MILVSACLAGENCRYDGTSATSPAIAKLVKSGQAVAACPEVLGRLGTPRSRAEIVGGDGWDVLAGRAAVMTDEGDEVTWEFIAGAHMVVTLAQATDCRHAILKSLSPSCGVGRIFDGSFSDKMRPGVGVTVAALSEAGITFESSK